MFAIKENNTVTKNVLWNTAGSLFYFVCQWLLSVAVVRFSNGFEDAGILSLAMSITNIFATIALFNIRNYQVSDSNIEFSSSDYNFHRILTCLSALILCCGFVILNSYNFYISASIIFYMVVKLVEAYADVLHGMAQIKWRLDIAGKSYIIRGILLISIFSISQYAFKNLALSIAMMSLSNLIALIAYDVFTVRKIDRFKFSFNGAKLTKLTKQCIPLLVYGLCTNSILSSARYFIDMFHGEEVLGYYATVSAVAIIVQALVTLIFTPLIGIFNNAYHNNDRRGVLKLFVKLVLLLLGITALSMVVITIAGEFIMTIVFGENIRNYVYLLYPTVVASCITALVWLLGMLLVVMRDTLTLMLGSIFGIVLCLTLSIILIPDMIYTGANIAIIFSLSIISAIYLVRFIIYLLQSKKE